MREVDVSDAGAALGALLDLVARGEEVVIIRRGRRVARLTCHTAEQDRGRAREAAADIVAQRRGATPGGLRIRNLIDEGRP